VGCNDRPGEKPDGRSDLITAPDLLSFAGIAPLVVPVISLDYHIAEKVHADTRGYRSAGTIQSTRVKDLVDLMLIAALVPVDARQVRGALVEVSFISAACKRCHRRSRAPHHPGAKRTPRLPGV